MTSRRMLACTAVMALGGAAHAQKPNLIMVSWSAPTTAQGYKTTINISFKVTNYGNGSAGAFGVRFYYGDSSSTSGLTTLGTHSFSGLPAATTSSTISMKLTLPGNVLYGNRYLHYLIDPTNAVSESNENDNRDSRSLAITGYPDITVTTLAVSPNTQSPGKTLTTAYRVYNAGYSRIPTYFYLRFYYSLTSAINTTDTYLNRQITVSSLSAGGYYPSTGNGVTTVTVPTGATSGTRYIGAIADYNHRVTEGSIANNVKAAAFTVKGAAGKADLQMYSWSAPATAVGHNAKVPITFRVRNAGTGVAAPFRVRFYWGLNTGASNQLFLTSYNHPGLGAGASGGTYKVTATLPAGVVAGYHFLHYRIDADSQVAETNESNNNGYRKLYVSGKPDIRVHYISVSPSSQKPGGVLTVKYRLRNYGYTMIPNKFYTRFYYSHDKTITTSDSYLKKQFSALRINASTYYPETGLGTVTVNVPPGAAAGTRYIGAYADYSKWIWESNTANNTKAAAFTVTKTPTLLANGAACSSKSQCKSGQCADGVCCNSGCGSSNPGDCQACSVKAGGVVNGLCGVIKAGHVCRKATGPCDKAETCSGKYFLCPANSYKPAASVCRKAAGACDKAEVCSGKAAACPANGLKPASTTCRQVAGPCDLPEVCTGKAAACPKDAFRSTKTTCRVAKDKECGLTEACTGKAAACPKDAHKPNATKCSKGVCANGVCKGGNPQLDLSVPDANPTDAVATSDAPVTDGVTPREAAVADGPTAGDARLDPPGDRGCTCQAGGGSASAPLVLLLLLALGSVRRRRG